MAYATKYRLSFTNVEGRSCQLDIQIYDYVGAITTVLGWGDSPVLIKRFGEDLDIINYPIRGSECTIKLVSQSNSQFAELFTVAMRPPKIEYLEDTVTLWTGFIHPKQYTEPYTIFPYQTTIQAYDGLGLLKEKEIKFVWLSKKENFEVTIIDLIAEIMINTNLNLGFQVFNNIHTAAGSPTAPDRTDILSDKKIDIRTFQDGDEYQDCYTILESICKSFGFLFYQNVNSYQATMSNQWYILRTKYFKFDVTHQFRRYDEQGVIGTASGTVDKKTITYSFTEASERCAFINNSAEISIIPFSEYQNFVHTMKRENNLISFGNECGNFDGNEFSGADILRWTAGEDANWNACWGENYIQLDKSFSPFDDPSFKSIRSDTIDLSDSFANGFKFNFDYYIYRTESASYIKLKYQVVYSYKRSGVTYKRYLKYSETWGDIWGEVDTEYWREVDIENKNELSQWTTEEVQTESILHEFGDTEQKIYVVICRMWIDPPSDNDYVRIKAVKLAAHDGWVPYTDTISETFKQEINEYSIFKGDDITTNVGSMFYLTDSGMRNPTTLMPRMFFIGSILYGTTNEPVLYDWKEWDHVSNILVDAWLIKDVLRFAFDRTAPTIILRGTIRGNLSFSTILVDKFGNRYFPNSIEYNPNLNQWKGEWLQILKVTPEIIGEFNDDFNNDFNI